MKEELMLLGFISLVLIATSSAISNICIPSKYYHSMFIPCTESDVERTEDKFATKHRRLMRSIFPRSLRRALKDLDHDKCKKVYEPFVSHEALEQLHRFIFVMASIHIFYSCLTMLLALLKISFLRQFVRSVVCVDYLALRRGFIANHNLSPKYDFHSDMICSMEEEFQRIVGVSGPLWGFVIAFMLFNIKGSNLYFWLAVIPCLFVLLIGAKLQHVIATLALEDVGSTRFYSVAKLKPRDDLFWFRKPELLLSLIHFILFQNAFELASFFWFWWQFGYGSCFFRVHFKVYVRLVIGFSGPLFSTSTLPLYALVTQMGSNYKAALIPQQIRETICGWGKAAKKKRRRGPNGESTRSVAESETGSIISHEESDDESSHGRSSSSGHVAETDLHPQSKTSKAFASERETLCEGRNAVDGTTNMASARSHVNVNSEFDKVFGLDDQWK